MRKIKKVIAALLSFIMLYTFIGNSSLSTVDNIVAASSKDFQIQSTHAYAEKSVVRVGENVVIESIS